MVAASGSAAEGEVVEDDVELGLGEAYLVLEVADDPVTSSDGVRGTRVGLEDDGAHGVVLGRRVEVADDLDDVADAEEAVGVQELALAVVGEVGGEDAVGGALPALVFAGGAGLGGGAVAAVVNVIGIVVVIGVDIIIIILGVGIIDVGGLMMHGWLIICNSVCSVCEISVAGAAPAGMGDGRGGECFLFYFNVS